MSRYYENHCVSCELPCLEDLCPYRNVPVDYCDNCDNEGAEYRVDGSDLCEECAEIRIKEAFDDLTLYEQAKLLNIDFNIICD